MRNRLTLNPVSAALPTSFSLARDVAIDVKRLKSDGAEPSIPVDGVEKYICIRYSAKMATMLE